MPLPELPDPTAPLERVFEAPVHVLVHRQARRTPDATAIVDESGSWTYGALDEVVSRLAQRLIEAPLRVGRAPDPAGEAPIAVWAHRSAGLPVALLAILAAGAGFAILDPAYPAARLAATLDDMRPRALVALRAAGAPPPEIAGRFDPGTVIDLPGTPVEAAGALSRWPAEYPDIPIDPDGMAYISFTSGTTGRPKGIVGTHRPLPHFLKWHIETSGFGAEDRFAMLSGLAHDPLLRDVFTPLVAGASLHVPPQSALTDPEALRAFLRRHRVTVIHITPSLGLVLTHGLARTDTGPRADTGTHAHTGAHAGAGEEGPCLRHVFFAGELLGAQVVERVRALCPGVRCTNFYGATETPQAMGYHPLPDDLSGEGPILPVGRGIRDVQLLVLDRDHKLCAPGEQGEICVRTPYLTRGYLNDPALTEERFLVNPFTGDPSDRIYCTGDLGRYRPDGVVEPAGRADHQVKIRGFRVELEEIEACLAACPGVEQGVVTLHDSPPREPRLIAYVRGEPDASTVRAFLRARLPDYMIPADVVRVERFALTPTGKVDRRALPHPPETPTPPATALSTPRTTVEAKLAALWAGTLHTATVGRGDSFFDLGGNSLVALELLDRVERELGKKLPVRSLITHPTVAAMAELLEGRAALDAASLLVAIRPSGTRPPVYWIPGGGGLSVMAFRGVSARLDPDQPVYGVEADLDLARAPSDLPGLASRYLREIQAFQPRGPYHLLGFSAGSWVAYEMGVQLRRRGEEVALLAVFDTEVPGTLTLHERALVLAQRARYRATRLLSLPLPDLVDGVGSILRFTAAHAAERWQIETDRIRSTLHPAPPAAGAAPTTASEVFQAVIQRNLSAVRRYASGPLPPYPGRIAVFLAGDTSMAGVDERIDPRLGWRTLAADGIDVYHAPGNHLSMLDPPHVDGFAAELRRCIASARSRPCA